jgi:hypothetical protein
MKKCLAYVAVLALLLSLGTVFAAAEDLPDGIMFTPGAYLSGNADEFAPVGDITVAWRPDISGTIDLTDGDLSDWYATDLKRTNITSHNMVTWILNETTNDFKITSFAAADSDYLYLAFDIVDDNFVYNTEDVLIGGDTIQLAMDFGGMLKKTLENEPDVLSNPKSIFYTFFCKSDGAPIRIMRQESDQDGWLTEANGDGVKGAARKTELGWSAEIALSWQLMYDDYVWKAWAEDPKVYIGSDEMLPLQVSACLYYVNYSANGVVQWAAGTTRPWLNDEGAPCVSWTAYDNGITWTLPCQSDTILNCTGISHIFVDYPLTETLPPETEPPYDPPVDEVTEPAIEYPETETMTAVEWEETLRDAAESLDKEDELNAILEKYGCTSVLGMGSLALLTTLAAAAFVIRKNAVYMGKDLP